MMMQRVVLAAGLALIVTACGTSRGRVDSAGGSVDHATHDSASRAPATARFASLGDAHGRVPILELHVVGDSTRGQFIISRQTFEHYLQTLYERGYRPITIAQLADKDLRDVPPGMSPVVFTFDDASPEQFSYVERNGQLEIDSTSVVGMWMDFAKRHPDWKGRATFCLLPAAQAGHAFFGDNPKYRGQKKEWRFQKVKWLADNGFEICNHTLWHAQLNKYPDAFVQEQIARGQMAIDSAVPGYKVRTFALPQGLWPKNRALAWQGSWTDPRTGSVHAYQYETVLEVSGGPARGPYDSQFDPRKLPRVIVFGSELEKTLDRMDHARSRLIVER